MGYAVRDHLTPCTGIPWFLFFVFACVEHASSFSLFLSLSLNLPRMGQATSTALAHKSKVFIDYDDFSSRFSKVAISTATAPLVIIAFPILNAYTFTEDEMTGVRMMDGVIGGLLGVIGCLYHECCVRSCLRC